jgi:hypothetical protein
VPRKPGPKGPDEALIRAIVELKSRNPRFGCPRIAQIISQTFGIDIEKNVVDAASGIMQSIFICRAFLARRRGGKMPNWGEMLIAAMVG